ncbi:MAG: DNA alkylation repair protein [Nitrospirae bacterium]|nr:DNA alkylation repair protein [Nitrospirota bacterium]
MVKTIECRDVVSELQGLANPRNVEGMTRYGINPKGTLGVSIPALNKIAGKIGKDHAIAIELWATGIHEARILASFVEDQSLVTPEQMDRWAEDFDSWDVCDQVCSKLFDRTPYAFSKARKWSTRDEEFVKRAGFVLMAAMSVHDKKTGDGEFVKFFPLIKEGATDERNFVKKAVNWALRQIGKRNVFLKERAIEVAGEIVAMGGKAPRWIGRDALRELSKF